MPPLACVDHHLHCVLTALVLTALCCAMPCWPCFVLRWAGLLCPADARLTSADSQDDDLDDLDPDVSFAWHVLQDVWQ
jgi:hypothetical protein